MCKKIPWGPTIFFILGFPLLLALGFWQLHRLDQKEQYLQWRHTQSTIPAVDFEKLPVHLNVEDYEFRRVRLKGQALPEIFTIPSRPHPSGRGFSGQYLLSPFLIEGTTEVILVNWGWIPNGKNISPPYHLKSIEALIRLPEKEGFFTPASNPSQRYSIIPTDFLVDHFPAFYATYTSFYLQWITEYQENYFFPRTLLVEPPLSNRHLQYAFTWFSFAFTFAVIYGIYLRRYRKSKE